MKDNIRLNEIKLDANNPRYATRKNQEKNVANFMIKHTKLSYINDMVKDVAIHGLSPLDIIGVFKEYGKYVALDGNRRILALKIIFDNSDMNLPDTTKDILQEFKKNAELNINKNDIEAFVFKDRAEAKKWLDRKHTSDFGGASAQDWPTLEKKIFQEDKLALIISSNADEAGITYDDYAINVKYTIWERFFASEFSRKWLGVSYNKDKKEFEVFEKEQLFERMKAIVAATNDGKINFQKVNKKTDKLKTIKMINENYLKETKFALNNQNKTSANPVKTKKSNKKIIENISILNRYIDNDKLKTILGQINKLNIRNYVELVSISIRPLIEITCWEYLTRKLETSNTWLDNNNLVTWINLVISEIEKSGFDRRNKETMKNIKNNISNLILATNGDIHDVEFISTERELKKNLKRVTIFLEEVWKKIH